MFGCFVRLVLLAAVFLSPLSPWPQGILLMLLLFEGATNILANIVNRLDDGRTPEDLEDALGFRVRRVD